MENAPYPSLPYSIRVQTRTAIVWMIWQDTAWDTPAPVTYNTDYEPSISVVKEYLTTASDGKNYNVTHYSLEMILAIGFRVKSPQDTQFRQ